MPLAHTLHSPGLICVCGSVCKQYAHAWLCVWCLFWLWSVSTVSKDTAESQPQGWTNRERLRPTEHHWMELIGLKQQYDLHRWQRKELLVHSCFYSILTLTLHRWGTQWLLRLYSSTFTWAPQDVQLKKTALKKESRVTVGLYKIQLWLRLCVHWDPVYLAFD